MGRGRGRINMALSRFEAALIITGALALLSRAAPRLLGEWSTNPNCQHVVFALPVALFFMVCHLRAHLGARRPEERTPSWPWALGLFGLSSICLYLDAVLAEEFLLGVGILLGGLGAVCLLWGRGALRACLFPALLLSFCVPLPNALARSILHINLQRTSAAAAAGVLSLLGRQVGASGTVIEISGMTLNVVESCSGLKFLTGMLFAALVAGKLVLPGKPRARVVLVLAAAVVAFATNAARLVTGALLAESMGMESALSFLHGWGIYVIYAGAACALLALATTLRNAARDPMRLAQGAYL